MAKKNTDDLVDAGSEYSFPASDPPSYMGGAAVAGPPPEDGEPPHEHSLTEVSDPDEVKPAEAAPHGTPDRTEERIRRRAYEIWESEDRSGDADEHWRRAEREVRGSAPAESQAAEAETQPPSEDAEKMAEQIKVAMDARNARSKQTKRAGTGGKKEGPKKSGPSKGGAPRSK